MINFHQKWTQAAQDWRSKLVSYGFRPMDADKLSIIMWDCAHERLDSSPELPDGWTLRLRAEARCRRCSQPERLSMERQAKASPDLMKEAVSVCADLLRSATFASDGRLTLDPSIVAQALAQR